MKMSLWAVAAGPAIAAAAPQTWEQNNSGQWQAMNAPATRPAADVFVENPTLDQIEESLRSGRSQSAYERVVNWIKSNPDAPDRDRGLYLLAEAYRQTGDRIRAFYHLDELMDYYPDSRLFGLALEKQYNIADDFLNGKTRRVLGFLAVTAREEAVEMLYRVQERAPGSPIAERALLRTADYYYDSSQFDLATDAYGAYIRAYPRSPEIPRVKLFRAFSSLAQFRGVLFDATPLIDAKAQLENILVQYPELSRQQSVRDFVDRIDQTLATKVFAVADFYRRTDQPRAAVYLWRYLVQTYPESVEAEKARGQLEKAPADVLALPPPAGGKPEEQLPSADAIPAPEADIPSLSPKRKPR